MRARAYQLRVVWLLTKSPPRGIHGTDQPGSLCSLFTGALGYEVTGSQNAAVTATATMAVLPAHLMRSVAGGYDNESIAVTAIVATFYFWVRSLRSNGSWPSAVLCGFAYMYMVAAWGGYIFVLNMIGVLSPCPLHLLFLLLATSCVGRVHQACMLVCWLRWVASRPGCGYHILSGSSLGRLVLSPALHATLLGGSRSSLGSSSAL